MKIKNVLNLISKYFPSLFLIAAICFFFSQVNHAVSVVNYHMGINEAKRKTIIVDAGHGGEDGGASGLNNTLEKEINLAIALKLKEILIKDQYKVIMTREGDYAIGDTSLDTISARKKSDMRERLRIINESGNCIYIAIHQNSFPHENNSGTEIYYSPNQEESLILAQTVMQSIANDFGSNVTRECRAADKNIFLLHNSQVPSILLECGFLTNQQDSLKLLDEEYQMQFVKSVHSGLNRYIELINTNESNINS